MIGDLWWLNRNNGANDNFFSAWVPMRLPGTVPLSLTDGSHIPPAVDDKSNRIRTLEDELAQAKADRDVLAAEVRAWRNAEHLRINEPHNEFMTRADARADTDASGALSRAGGK